MNAQDLSNLRAKHIYDARQRLDNNAERKREYLAGRHTLWVVYTGRADCPVWINEQAVRAGKYSISLSAATRYTGQGRATYIASEVRNGNGERGHAVPLDKAYDMEIACINQFIKSLEEAEQQALATPV